MRHTRSITLSGVLAIAAVGAAGCGGNDSSSGGGSGASSGGSGGAKSLTIYSSLPEQGAQGPQSKAIENGIRLALKQAGNKAGNNTVTYKNLDDSTAQAGQWTPEKTSQNARTAAKDSSTAAYIGEFNSGASAISIPLLAESGVPQISPSNTAVGLTSNEPGADKGEPEKYYQGNPRNYVRIVPKDTIQGAALATVMKQDGCTTVFIANDKEVYGAGLARNIVNSAQQQGLKIAGNEGIDPKAPNYRSLAQRAKAANADCFAFSGTTSNNAVQAYKDFAAALGANARFYGPDGVAEETFTNPKKGGLPSAIARRTKLTVATLNPSAYPPEGRQFFQQYGQQFGDTSPDPYSIYGFEAARLALDAIERSGTGNKPDIIKALFSTKDRKSVLGTYSIDQNGDTTLTTYGVYTIKGGQLSFSKSLEASK